MSMVRRKPRMQLKSTINYTKKHTYNVYADFTEFQKREKFSHPVINKMVHNFYKQHLYRQFVLSLLTNTKLLHLWQDLTNTVTVLAFKNLTWTILLLMCLRMEIF